MIMIGSMPDGPGRVRARVLTRRQTPTAIEGRAPEAAIA
jgi:hypothetical protein